MKPSVIMLALAALTLSSPRAQGRPQPQPREGYPVDPVPFTSVRVAPQSFWGHRIELSRRVTVPLAFSKCEETGRYTNFENAARHLANPQEVFEIKKGTFSFDDTDPYKTIEGASYLLQTYPDAALQAYVDSIIDIIASAQEPDGYLYTARTQNPAHPHGWAGTQRWEGEEWQSHELYDLGHMVEAAIAHYQATGSRRFLDVACRYADCVVRQVGPAPGQATVVPGHQIAEMALARLYLVTGERRYLDQAKYFLDYRGRTATKSEYSQSHLPVTEQQEAVGHAVRAGYMYAGMADVAALTGDTAYIGAIDRIWHNIVGRKLYITGGVGATSNGEAFGRNYELPNETAYCETCAAIAQVYVNHRLFLLHGEAKYYDVLERTLLNGLLAGYSLTGDGFFYPNPLESTGQHERQPWFGCACCPSNISRFIPSLPGYVYAVRQARPEEGRQAAVYVNLYVPNRAELQVGGKRVLFCQTTEYPLQGKTALVVEQNRAGCFQLKLRLPGWARNEVVPSDLYTYADTLRPRYTCTVNGQAVDAVPQADGYLTLERRWKRGDRIELQLDMPARLVRAHPKVQADRGMVAIERGPLVFCAEWPDNQADVQSVLLSHQPRFAEDSIVVAGSTVPCLHTQAQQLAFGPDGRLTVADTWLTLIPYYAWAHRGRGKMRVWQAWQPRAVRTGE